MFERPGQVGKGGQVQDPKEVNFTVLNATNRLSSCCEGTLLAFARFESDAVNSALYR